MKTFKYQNKRDKNYFEGWYLRFTNSQTNDNYAVIFALTKSLDDPHSFIQVFHQDDDKCEYLRFSLNDFSYDFGSNTVRIKNNYLSLNELHVEGNQQIDISLKNHSFLKVGNNNKSAMSYLRHFPLECFQEVIYLDAEFSGTIKKGNEINISGKAYLEKTYGNNFPSKWVWLQSNHNLENSFSFSVGKVPFHFLKINGFFLLLQTKDKYYRFSTTNLSTIKVEPFKGGVVVIIRRGFYKVKIHANMLKSTKLVGPSKGGVMSLTVNESLQSTARIKLYKFNKLIFDELFENVGFENMYK